MKQQPITYPALMALALSALLLSCAPGNKPKIASAQESVDTWKAMEKQAQGHSPRGQFMLTEPPVVIDRPEQIDQDRRAAQRKLPETRLSLRMHNADVVAVLQGLSRAVGKSIVVSPGVTGVINVNFVERPWDEIFRAVLAANKLTYSFDGETLRVMAQADLQGTLDLEAIKRKTLSERLASLAEEPQVTSVAKVRFADAKMLQKTVESALSKTRENKPIGSVQVDELTNSLIIQGVEQDLGKIAKLLAKLDAPRSQIKLKAHIVETTKEVARSLGIMWGGWYRGKVGGGNNSNLYLSPGGTGTTTTTVTGATSYTPTLGTGVTGQGLGVSLPASGVSGAGGAGASLGVMFGNIGSNVLETQLQALENDNKLNIISSPSIATMDNQKAYTESGEKVPYQTVTGTGTSATTSVSFQDAVLRLEITPHIIDEEFIKLQVLIQKDEVDTTRVVGGNPYIVKKKTETTLIARNGETVVISGLSKLRNSLREAGIPGVKDVPGLGWLGKSETKSDLKDEFMIFITPEVLADWRKGERQKTFDELHQEGADRRAAEAEAAKTPEQPAKGAAPSEPGASLLDSSPPTSHYVSPVVSPSPSASVSQSASPAPSTSVSQYASPAASAPASAPASVPVSAPAAASSSLSASAAPSYAAPAPAPEPMAAAPVPAVGKGVSAEPVVNSAAGADPAAVDSALLKARPRKPALGGRQ